MTSVPDTRRLRVNMIDIANGEFRSSHGADIWQVAGDIEVSGIWNGVVPLMPEDIQIRANRLGISPLEWLRQRLLLSQVVDVEVIDG